MPSVINSLGCKYTVYMELLASQIFGDLLYKCSWRDFYLAVLSTVWKETHALQPKWCAFNLAIFT